MPSSRISRSRGIVSPEEEQIRREEEEARRRIMTSISREQAAELESGVDASMKSEGSNKISEEDCEEIERKHKEFCNKPGSFRHTMGLTRNSLMCTICDQFLYEPWVLACGHTYCYTCLCSWFIPNKHKKTCPDCRSPVRDMPTPSYLVKQIVDKFISCEALMEIGETAEDFSRKAKEETATVEADRASINGLFRGCFKSLRMSTLTFDEADGVHRCGRCACEYIGGLFCGACGFEFDQEDDGVVPDMYHEHDFSDDEDLEHFDEYDIEQDLDDDLDGDDEDDEDVEYSFRHPHYYAETLRPAHVLVADNSAVHPTGSSSTSDDDGSDEDDRSLGSLQDFLDDDEDPHHHPAQSVHITIHSDSRQSSDENSDEESDEGGPITNSQRRARNGLSAVRGLTRNIARRSADAVTRRLGRGSQHSGENDNSGESDSDEDHIETARFVPIPRMPSEGTSSNMSSSHDETEDSEESDNSTIGDNRYQVNDYMANQGYSHHDWQPLTDDESADGPPTADEYPSSVASFSEREPSTDRDGDVEMSQSPPESSVTSGVSREESVEYLGTSNQFHDLDNDESDQSVQPVRLRRAPRHTNNPRYSNQIHQMLEEHIISMHTAEARYSPYFDEDEIQEIFRSTSRSIERNSRPRVGGRYRSRNHEPYPSRRPATLLLPSHSSRPSRPQREIQR